GDPEAYDYMISYSPYDQVEAKPYPPLLAPGGLSAPRVTYWEPGKWVARLRPATTSDDPVLLKINLEASHGGAAGRFDYLKEVAHDYAFAVWAVDKGWERAGPCRRRSGTRGRAICPPSPPSTAARWPAGPPPSNWSRRRSKRWAAGWRRW